MTQKGMSGHEAGRVLALIDLVCVRGDRLTRREPLVQAGCH